MKKLTDILKNTPVREVCGDTAAAIGGLVYDSRAVKPGDCFFAVPGTQSDGHDYIPIAVEKGAAAIVCERMPADAAEGVAYVLVGDSAGAMADMAAAFYDYPSRELKLVGITGTNGKTTTATLLYDLVRAMGYKAGLISTVVYKIDGREVEATHTTPDSIRLNAMMREMADAGCAYCFMECSSHAIVQERTRGLDFAGGIFSNITHDHLDYHKTFAEYIRAKKLFFDGLPKGAFALTNADDRNGRVMVQNTAAAVSAYSLRAMADFRCKIVEMHPDGMLLRIDGQDGLVLDSLSQSGIVLPEEALLRRLSRLFGAPPDQRSMQALFQEMGVDIDPKALVADLKTGQKQLLEIARALLFDAKLLILDEPTRGIDVGAKYEIYQLMNELIDQGISIVMISSELPEIIGMSDRIYIMYEGKIRGELNSGVDEITQENILYYAAGGKKEDDK